jgi:hypothetical protein
MNDLDAIRFRQDALELANRLMMIYDKGQEANQNRVRAHRKTAKMIHLNEKRNWTAERDCRDGSCNKIRLDGNRKTKEERKKKKESMMYKFKKII